MSTPKFVMESFFTDASDTNYDSAIDSTRNLVNNLDNPCDVASAFLALTTKLKGLQMEYYRLPVIEGYCFNLVTPHRDRIQRRVDTLEGERGVFLERCIRFQQDQAYELAKTRAEAKKMKAEATLINAEVSRVHNAIANAVVEDSKNRPGVKTK